MLAVAMLPVWAPNWVKTVSAVSAMLVSGYASVALAACPSGTTMVIVKKVLEVCEVADAANHKLLLPDPRDCPEGTSSVTLPGGVSACRGSKNSQLRDIILPLDGGGECPVGYRHGVAENGQTVCESAIVLPTSANGIGAGICPGGTVPSINLNGAKDCRRDARVAVDKLYAPSDGCPVNAQPGTDEQGNAVCYQR